MTRVTESAPREEFWRAWLRARLPEELYHKLSGVAAREDSLTLFAESAAWCARLRFAITELEPGMRSAEPTLGIISVRVLPRR